MIGTNESFSTVGISFGLDVIYAAMSSLEKEGKENPNVDYCIVPLGTQKEALLLATYLRNKGYKVEYELSNKKLGKALDRANKEKFRNVIIIGEDEVKNNQFKVKDMISGEEKLESYNYNSKQ